MRTLRLGRMFTVAFSITLFLGPVLSFRDSIINIFSHKIAHKYYDYDDKRKISSSLFVDRVFSIICDSLTLSFFAIVRCQI